MKVAIIGCPFRTTYGEYIGCLRAGLESRMGSRVTWVGTNCGCNDPIELALEFQTEDCNYFEMPNNVGRWTFNGYSRNPVKRVVRSGVRYASNRIRVSHFLNRAQSADVVHLQQTLNAYSFDIACHLLRQCKNAARVITLHELDPEQSDNPDRNRIYNFADAVIVHDSLLKAKLVSLGVEWWRVYVVPCGTDLTEGESVKRDGIVFYGGHHLDLSKGADVLLKAYSHLRERSKKPLPRLRIHGHYGPVTPPDMLELAQRLGIAESVDWLNDVPTKEVANLYRRSQVCVLPFRASFAGAAAGVAAASRLPVIATRLAGVPDHIGNLGIWVEPGDHVALSDRIGWLLESEEMARDYGERLRAHAEQYLSWDAVARETLAVYTSAEECARIRNRWKVGTEP